jgi:FKBP-type peptidyl-prolyl cis-trans isomerase
MKTFARTLGLGLLALGLAGCFKHPTAANPAADATPSPARVTASGLKLMDYRLGSGPEAMQGRTVSVHYTGWLENGAKFDSSVDRGQPFEFTLGAGNVIKGWDEGVLGMRVGGKRQLTVPPAIAYGQQGAPPTIPPNATLVFDVELLSVK